MELRPIDKDEAARYMGVNGAPDGAVLELLDRVEPIVRRTVRPNYVYIVTDISFEEGGVRLGSIPSLFTGESIKKHLSGCTKAVILAATLSGEADKLIRQTAVTDMAESLAADCLCSAAIEQVCNNAEDEIFQRIDAPYRTWRFSPGYGDLPITLQGDILRALNAQRRIGLTLTDSMLLLPSKSVTAIIGISDSKLNRGARGCAICNMRESCAFAYTKNSCGSRR